MEAMRRLGWVCVLSCVAACQPRGSADPAHDAARVPAASVAKAVASNGLQVTIHDALRTDHLQPSRFEDKEPAPGDTFVVLDVQVRNPGRDTRVFNAGPLVVVANGREHRFDTPENVIADGYLLLEALKPATSVRGRIVYEIPAGLTGPMYWLPGNGQRLAVQVGPARRAPPTADQVETARAPLRASESQAPAKATVPPAVAPDQVRRLACRALVANNDPAEREHYRGFFRQQCAGFPMPKAWLASTRAAPPNPAGPPSRGETRKAARADDTAIAAPEPSPKIVPSDSGPSFDCAQAVVRAEHLVCADALLSLLDRELAQAVSDAERKVPDPAALLHDQDDWRARVRDACQTLSCLERVYTQRTAGLRSIGGFAEVK